MCLLQSAIRSLHIWFFFFLCLLFFGCTSATFSNIQNIRKVKSTTKAMDSEGFAIMTFNIRAGGGTENFGMSPKLVKATEGNLSKIADAINSIDPDIVGLQEVRGYHQARFIAEKLNMNFAYSTHGLGRSSWWGLAILSKFTILDITTQNINYGDDNRVGQLSTFEINGKIIKVLNLHYALENYDTQAKASVKLLEDVKVPFVLIGDLNRQYFDPELDPIKEKLIDTCSVSKTNKPNKPCGAETFGGFLLPEGVRVKGRRIDYIFVDPYNFYVADVGITPNEYCYVSDHRAYWAKIKLNN